MISARGSRPPPEIPGVRSQKVQRVILSVQSVLPSEGKREGPRKFEKVLGSWRKFLEVGEGSRKFEKYAYR